MTSWRDSASPEAQDDLDGLLDAVLGFAQQQLDARGELFPYAAAVGRDGETEMLAAQPDADEAQPRSAAEGHALTVLLPYDKKRAGRGIAYGQLRAQVGSRHIWT